MSVYGGVSKSLRAESITK